MADNFSLDDILAEIDAKKAGKGEEQGSGQRKSDLSVTSIINDDELNAALSGIKGGSGQKSEYSVTSIINSTSRKKSQGASGNAVSSEKDNVKTAAAEKKTEPKPEPKKDEAVKTAEQPVKAEPVKTEEPKNKTAGSEIANKPAADIKNGSEEKSSESDAVEKSSKEKRKPKSDFFAAVARKLSEPAKNDDIKEKTGKGGDEIAFPEETPKTDEASKNDSRNEKPRAEEEKPKKPAKRTEYDTAQRKLIDRQLRAEEELESPEDMIDFLNPLEAKSKAQEMSSTADISADGDTQGISGNELKKLAEQSASPKAFDERSSCIRPPPIWAALCLMRCRRKRPRKPLQATVLR